MSNEKTNQNCKLISAKELSKLLSTSVRSIWRYRSSCCLPKPVKISGAIRWKIIDIELFLECNCDMAKFQARKEAENC